MTEPLVGLTQQSFKAVARTVREYNRNQEPLPKITRRIQAGGSSVGIVQGELTGNLTPATNSKTGATSVTAQAYVVDTPKNGSTPAKMKLSGDDLTIVVRSSQIKAVGAGTYCIWAPDGDELLILWVDCPNT